VWTFNRQKRSNKYNFNAFSSNFSRPYHVYCALDRQDRSIYIHVGVHNSRFAFLPVFTLPNKRKRKLARSFTFTLQNFSCFHNFVKKSLNQSEIAMRTHSWVDAGLSSCLCESSLSLSLAPRFVKEPVMRENMGHKAGWIGVKFWSILSVHWSRWGVHWVCAEQCCQCWGFQRGGRCGRCTYSALYGLLFADRLKLSNEKLERTYTYHTSYTSPCLTLIQMAILGLLTLVAEDAYAHENVGVCVLGHQC